MQKCTPFFMLSNQDQEIWIKLPSTSETNKALKKDMENVLVVNVIIVLLDIIIVRIGVTKFCLQLLLSYCDVFWHDSSERYSHLDPL